MEKWWGRYLVIFLSLLTPILKEQGEYNTIEPYKNPEKHSLSYYALILNTMFRCPDVLKHNFDDKNNKVGKT